MDYLSLIQKPIEKELEDFVSLFNETLTHTDGLLAQALEHIRNKGGKRMRPILILLLAKSFGGVTSIINKQDLIGTWAFNANNYVYKDCVEKRRLVFSEKEVTNYFYNFDKKKNECFNMVWTMSYRLSGDKIILKYSNGATLTNKIELSGNELRLTFFDDTLSKQMITQIYTRQSNEKKNIH